MPLQVMLIETEGMRVLVDTGMGDVSQQVRPQGRTPPDELGLLEIGQQDIDILFLTHGHPDHVGGLTVEGERAFTDALHYCDVEFEFWTQEPDRAPAALREMIRECRTHILPVAHGLKSYSDGEEIAPGARGRCARYTHGHFALRLESKGEKLLHLVDTSVHYIANLEHPEWTVGADLDKPRAVETRKRLLAQAAEEQIMVAGYHFPFPGVGRILRMGDGFRYVPVPLV